MKQFFKNFFTSTHGPIILTCLCLILVIGAAAVLVPAANQAVDKSDCRHPYARLINQGETDAGTDYVFRCPTCLATIHETPETSQFVLHKPTIINGVVTMASPWEIGAYYGSDYRLMNKKATDDWYTDGELWITSTGVRVRDYEVCMATIEVGNGAITYVAQDACYVRPLFDYVACGTPAKRCEFAIYLNGERVAPTDNALVLNSAAAGSVVLTGEWNEQLADTWIHMEKGDKLSFVILYTDTVSTELRIAPAVEVMQYNPNRK